MQGFNNIPDCFYRVSVKALVIDEQGRFLLQKEARGVWDLPGGGLDFGEEPTAALRREVAEEAGLEVLSMDKHPSYFVTAHGKRFDVWFANIIYKAKFSDITKFVPSDECVEMRYFSAQEVLDAPSGEMIVNVVNFAQQYIVTN